MFDRFKRVIKKAKDHYRQKDTELTPRQHVSIAFLASEPILKATKPGVPTETATLFALMVSCYAGLKFLDTAEYSGFQGGYRKMRTTFVDIVAKNLVVDRSSIDANDFGVGYLNHLIDTQQLTVTSPIYELCSNALKASSLDQPDASDCACSIANDLALHLGGTLADIYDVYIALAWVGITRLAHNESEKQRLFRQFAEPVTREQA